MTRATSYPANLWTCSIAPNMTLVVMKDLDFGTLSDSDA